MESSVKKTIFLLCICSILFLLIAQPFTLAIIDTKSNTSYALLIIAPQQFKQELRPLVNHKNEIGVSTTLVLLPDIYDQMSSQGRDNPEKIKLFIKQAVEEWDTKYVLLVGGKKGQSSSWYVPVRYVDMDDHWEAEYISDLYYADIYNDTGGFSTWNSDDDSRFGEWYYNESAQDYNFDLTPDVAVGRLPCRSPFEVRVSIQKIISYETSSSKDSWFKRFLVIAGDTYPVHQNPNWTGYEGEYYGNLAIQNMTGFSSTRLYTSNQTLTGASDVIQAFNQGYGFVYFVGHGSPKTWGNHPPDNESFINGLTVYDMWKLRNIEKLPVCVVSGCHNCQFDVSLFRLFNKTTRYRQEGIIECWGERLLRKTTGGVIATLGCNALGYTKEDKQSFKGGTNELEVEFFHSYGFHQNETLGDSWKAAITWYTHTYPVNFSTQAVSDSWIDAKVVQSWVLLGDPSLRIG